MTKWLAKVDLLLTSMHLERAFLGQQKYYHFRTWYRNDLAEFVRELLLDPTTHGGPYISEPRVAEMVRAHTSGRGNYTLELHKLITTDLLERTLLKAP